MGFIKEFFEMLYRGEVARLDGMGNLGKFLFHGN